jgi:hypothetical protein
MFKAVGFIGSLAAGAALVGAAVTGTGAYFTDSHNGSLTASSGHLTMDVSNTTLSFSDLMPGVDKTNNIDFKVSSEGRSDVWVTFDPTSPAYLQFTGAKGVEPVPGGGLGRFGHFAVSVNGGNPIFESYNLQNGTGCGVDAFGNGGSNQQATASDLFPPLCGVPAAIRIASNLSDGQSATLNVTFGATGKQTAQRAPIASVPFKIVATQAGVRPDAANF